MEQVIVANVLAIAAAYRKATGKSLTQIGKAFYGRGDFFDGLKDGSRSISVRQLDAMIAQFRAEWPEGAPWPACRVVSMGRNPQA